MKNSVLILFALCFWINAQSQQYITGLKKIGPGLYLVWYDGFSNKSIVAEFRDFIAVIEFPQNESVSHELITRMEREFPGKKIRYVMHSHHHSHSVSAFDPFLTRTKAKLVTTKYNLAEIKKLTRDTVGLVRQTIVYQGGYSIKDKFNEVEILEINQKEYPVPTTEYNIFNFPGQSAMVSGCLFNKPQGYYEVVNRRKTALKDFMNQKNIKATSIIPTNTTRSNGFLDVCTNETLDSTLSFGLDPDKFNKTLKMRSVEYLLGQRDSLKSELSKIPRSYDYLVCVNSLIGSSEFLRAISILRPLSELYPKEGVIQYFTAQCYEGLNLNMEAVLFYEKYAKTLSNSQEVAEIKLKIDKLSKP